jgi:hypothetical protein
MQVVFIMLGTNAAPQESVLSVSFEQEADSFKPQVILNLNLNLNLNLI